jgi:radical SAM protein with 4Fe4S-binding SPASM domain
MCDIWKNKMENELQPEEYRKLPASLKGINISGGEPFLRKDLPDVIRVIKETCPNARLVISTNGFIPDRIGSLLPDIIRIDPKIAVRISIDGMAKTHEEIRGIPEGFHRDMESLELMKKLGVRDLGLAMTVMETNVEEMPEVYKLANDLGVELSLTIATDSEVFFGDGKDDLRPKNNGSLKRSFDGIIQSEYTSWEPRRWFRAWYEKHLIQYTMGHGRPIPCDAGKGFFYLDSNGNVYACHILPTVLGNIRENDWEEIWESPGSDEIRRKINGCEQCWMVCTSKSEIRKKILKIGLEVIGDKVKSHLT